MSSESAAPLIAICGLALRAPGGIRNTTDYWDLLVNGKDARGPIPNTRYNIAGFDDSLGGRGPIKTKFGYFLDEDLTKLDTSFFSMSRKEVERCDPQQRLLLEVSREALEDAGEVHYRGKQIGCFVGTFGDDWAQIAGKETLHPQGGLGYVTTGHGDLMLSNRVSYEMDLKGPSMTVKTGCSASLIALHEACRAIADGDAESALVGGSSLIMTPTITAAFFAEGILSPDGSCKSFDAAADGFARAEAVTAVYIKSLSAAVRDGNAIRAVIRATGANSDGKGQGMMAPNGEAQEALMRKVYRDAHLDPSQTAFVELHGTGTATGGPIEAGAVGNVFGDKGVLIGSVKPNVGHSEGSSGLNSLIKCVLALEHKLIPPNIKFINPNPKIPFAEKRLEVPLVPRPFPGDRAERISINSFGIGGANAHCILDAYRGPIDGQVTPPASPPQGSASTLAPKSELLLLSANTTASIKSQVERHLAYMTTNTGVSTTDLAYTLAKHREKLPHRAFAIVQAGGTVVECSPATKAPAKVPNTYLVFSGQGAQWPRMGAELALTNVDFRADMQKMDNVLQGLTADHRPEWSLLEELLKPAETSRVHVAEISQPLCTAVQIALYNRLQAVGVVPTAVVGHSSGEIAAAYATGAMTLEAAILVAFYRGWVTKQQTQVGMMGAVGLGPAETTEYLVDGVVVACENSPLSSTISGDSDKVREVLAKIKAKCPDTLARPLKVDMAYHSHHMVALGEIYQELLHEVLPRCNAQTQTPSGHATTLFSTVTGKPTDPNFTFPAEYWVSNLVSPVRFSTAVAAILQTLGDGIFVELGPHSALAGPIRQICSASSKPCEYTSCLVRGSDATQTLLATYGKLFQQGVDTLDLGPLFPPTAKVLTGLPAYAWDHSGSFWYESRISAAWRSRKYAHHALLGARQPESPDTCPSWRNVLYLEDEAWIADHKVKEDVVFPMAGFVAMAGEAVRQMAGGELRDGSGYSLRSVVAHAALVLVHEKGAELITTLRKHALTESDVSEWFEFSISSYNGATWIKHIEGQVKAVDTLSARPSDLVRKDFPRQVSISRFYDYMSDVGIVFGPEFRRLEHVSAATTEARASAVMSLPDKQASKPYVMHPSAIDACFQLCILSQAKGLGRNFTQLVMPTRIESLEIRSGGEVNTLEAWGPSAATNLKEGCECAADGKSTLRLFGFELTPLEEGSDIDYDPYAAARLEWLPDFDFVDVAPLFKAPPSNRENLAAIEQLTLLCIIDSHARLQGLTPAEPHFEKLRDFLGREIQAALDGKNALCPKSESASWVNMSAEDRDAAIEKLYVDLSGKARDGLTQGLVRVRDNIERIFLGEAQTIDILMEGGVLAELYNAMSFGYSDFVQLLSSTKPTLRILEVGAGTGGTTELILRDLMHEGGLPRYSTYTFTDVSAGFFPQAKERFSYAPNMDYQVFDISEDPLGQGFTEGTYDVIFAANVVHATETLKDTLSNLNKLLRPGGALVMTEICTELRSPTYVFGNFIGWWLGEADGRPFAPYVPPARWHDELLTSGYSGVETAVYDEEAPYMCCTTIYSRKTSTKPKKPKNVSLLTLDPAGDIASGLKTALEASAYNVTTLTLGKDALPDDTDRDILVTVDVEKHFFENIDEPSFLAFRDLIRAQSVNQNLLWLTSPSQIKCKDPRSAPALGAARTIRTELAVPFHTLEISTAEPDFNNLVLKVFGKVRIEEDDDNLVADKEFVVDNGVICIGRYHPFSLTAELAQKSLLASAGGTHKALRVGRPGDIESLTWTEIASPAVLGPDDVEIEPRAIALNLRDILIAMGVIPHTELGFDAAGVVVRCGARACETFAPGDRVYAFCPDGSFGTRAVLNRHHMAKIPETLSFEDASSVPVVFATTIHGLINICQLQKGQSVLIHAACGGLGLSAIQVCKMVGAEIYVTCGSQDKIDFLVNKQGISRDHIFHSRDESFVDGILGATGGIGCDVVINSLSGVLLHASWKCVAEFGTMLEIGKRDMLGHGKLDLNPFLGNRRFVCFEGVEMARKRPAEFGRVLTQFNEYYEKGLLGPIQEISCYDAADVVAAFRHLQHGSHIGKVVVSMKDAEAALVKQQLIVPQAKAVEFDPAATYLLTGGLGGLGKAMSTWLVEHGAKSLTFLSRSAGTSEDSKAAIRELESLGVEVTAVAGGVENEADVEAAIKASNRPIKGVFHLAMVLRDSPMVDMTWRQWDEVSKVKVDGAWNLHNSLAAANAPLDFFCLASSVVTVVDQPGQGNYSAASTFVEAFAQYRRGLGLPASVLNICPVKGVGFVAENAHAMRNTKAQGIYFLGESSYLDFVEHSILSSKPAGTSSDDQDGPSSRPPFKAWKNEGQVIMGLRSELHLDDPANRCNWRRDRRMGAYHNIRSGQMDSQEDGNNSGAALKSFLAQAAEDPELLDDTDKIDFLALQIGAKVFDFMLKPGEDVDTSLSLQQIGLDSLMATELRRWFRQLLGLQVSVLEIMATGSLTHLAKLAAAALKNKYTSAG